MSNMTSQTGRKCFIRAQSLGVGLIYGVLAALPLLGLLAFLQITRPAHSHSMGAARTNVASYDDGFGGAAISPLRHNAVAKFKGVSAELGTGSTQTDARVLSASDAMQAFSGAAKASLKAGFKTEFVTKDHRRIAIRIVQREQITDRAAPDNAQLVNIVPASTANTVSFVWGGWLYVAAVEDKGIEPDLAVQEVL
jgi:hypothetical protein